MRYLPKDGLKSSLRAVRDGDELDNSKVVTLKRLLADEFREQLTYGVPTAEVEAGLRRLAKHIRAGKVVVKLFLRYLLFRYRSILPDFVVISEINLIDSVQENHT